MRCSEVELEDGPRPCAEHEPAVCRRHAAAPTATTARRTLSATKVAGMTRSTTTFDEYHLAILERNSERRRLLRSTWGLALWVYSNVVCGSVGVASGSLGASV